MYGALTSCCRNRNFGTPSPYRVYDTFTDADTTALTSHTQDVGSGWSAGIGTWQINTNRAKLATTGAPGTQAIVYTEAGVADHTVKATCRATSGTQSTGAVATRYDHATKSFVFAQVEIGNGQFRLYRFNGTNYTQLGQSAFSGSANTDYLIQIVTSGSSITATRDGANTISVTETQNQSSTKVGLRGDSTPCAADTFTVPI